MSLGESEQTRSLAIAGSLLEVLTQIDQVGCAHFDVLDILI
jgi:hypothetical protein